MMHRLDPLDRTIINHLQGGFPLSERPFREAGAELGIGERELIERLRQLVERGTLSRFGPIWNAERLGGGSCLCAMAVPPDRFEAVAALVNRRPEVAHNYERAHAFNMWFVVASEQPQRVAEIVAEIESESGLAVHAMPKAREFFLGFRLEV
jgi:DNA-binding Lrp family transcriptional regulator